MQSILGVPIATLVVVVAGLFVAGLGALTVLALRDRLLLTLALRNVPRRRAQSALIAVGLALSTVIVTTALNTGDTMSHTVRSLVAGSVGRADEIVVRPRRDARRVGFDNVQSVANGTFLTGSLQPFDASEADRLRSQLADDDRIAAIAPAFVEQVVAMDTTSGELQAQLRLLALPRDYPAIFGTPVTSVGQLVHLSQTEGAVVLMTQEAATALGTEAGHTLAVHLGERRFDVTVAAVIRSGDLTGAQPTLIMPLDEFQRLAEVPGQINQILIANRGDPTTSVQLSAEVAAAIRPHLVDPEAARRIHALLRSDVARAELRGVLPALDPRSREQVEALLQELDRDQPTDRFAAIVSDPELERRLIGVSGRLAAQQGRAGTSALATTSTLRVVEVKRLSQDLADRWGGALTSVFVVLGLFSIATGTMLVVLIFVLLAAERRTELGVLRALGARRGRLMAMLLYEGVVYDLIAAAVGLLVGIGVALGLMVMSGRVLSGFGIELVPRLEPRSLVLAYCLGAVITMVSIVASAWHAGRLTIVAAIKDLPEPERPARVRRTVLVSTLLAGLGALLLYAGTGSRFVLPTGLGVLLLVYALASLASVPLGRLGLAPRTVDRLRYTAAGLCLIAYWLLPNDVIMLAGQRRPGPRSVDLFFVVGLSLILGGVWVLAYNLELAARLIHRFGAGSRGGALVPRLALAFPVQHRFRTGMTVAMFGLVIFGMVVAAVLLTGTHRAYSDPDALAGGYDIRVDETAGGAPALRPLLDGALGARAEEFEAIGTVASVPAEGIEPTSGVAVWRPVGLNLVDDELARTIRSELSGRAHGYPSDAAVWEAIRTQPGVAIAAGPVVRSRQVDAAGLPVFHLSGIAREDSRFAPTTVWVRDTRGGRAVKLTVIGVLDPRASFGSGLFTSAATLADAGTPAPTRTVTYLRTRPGVSAAEKTLALNLALGERGLRASEIGEDVRRILGLRMLLNDLLQSFIGVGLLAGIAGLGVISMRAVVERRQQIGMLRALGLTRGAVQATFLLEASIVALLGIGIGTGLGLALAARLVEYLGREFPEIVFTIPWQQIGGIVAFAYVAALLTTLWPAWRAGQVEPARALRYE